MIFYVIFSVQVLVAIRYLQWRKPQYSREDSFDDPGGFLQHRREFDRALDLGSNALSNSLTLRALA